MPPSCSSGCPTQNHRSYSECLRDKGASLNAGAVLSMEGKHWDSELQAYRDARSQGIQPAGTTMQKVREAVEISDARGVAYQADVPSG